MAKKDREKLEKLKERLEETLSGLDKRLGKLEDRFYEDTEHTTTDRDCWTHWGITDDGPPAEELLKLILDHLGLEVEKAERWRLKKK